MLLSVCCYRPMHVHTCIYAFTQMHIYARTHKHSFPLYLSLSLTHILIHTLSLTHTHPHTQNAHIHKHVYFHKTLIHVRIFTPKKNKNDRGIQKHSRICTSSHVCLFTYIFTIPKNKQIGYYGGIQSYIKISTLHEHSRISFYSNTN